LFYFIFQEESLRIRRMFCDYDGMVVFLLGSNGQWVFRQRLWQHSSCSFS